MVELADTPDLGSGAVRRTGSSPAIRTRLSLDASRVLGLAFSFAFFSRLERVSNSSTLPDREPRRASRVRGSPVFIVEVLVQLRYNAS